MKPQWTPLPPKDRKLCRNCGWRVSVQVAGGDLPHCQTCADAFVALGAKDGQTIPAASPRPSGKSHRAHQARERIKEQLADQGFLPVTCKNCGGANHTSATCDVPPRTLATLGEHERAVLAAIEREPSTKSDLEARFGSGVGTALTLLRLKGHVHEPRDDHGLYYPRRVTP
jgi:hypothetical protein